MEIEDALTVPQVARELEINQATVRRRIASGELAGVRVGGKIFLIPRAEVERAKEAGRLKPGPKRKVRE